MDYHQGIPERLEALEWMFEKYPQWADRFCFIQIGVPSRVELREYARIQSRTRRLTHRSTSVTRERAGRRSI